MECLECGKEMYHHDTTYSNVTTSRCRNGEKTGDIYKCDECEQCYIDDYLSGTVHEWHY
jgi:hypothetical protein